jgi:hypothetical protein
MTMLHLFVIGAVFQFLMAAGLFLRAAAVRPTPPFTSNLRFGGTMCALIGGAWLATLVWLAWDHGGHLPSFPVISISFLPSFAVVGVWVVFLLFAVSFFMWQLARFLRGRSPHGGSALSPDSAAEGSL